MADKQNWDLINKKNSIGPALGMAMGKAIDLTIAFGWDKDIDGTRKVILELRDWIYEENNKRHQELLLKLPKEGDNKQDELDF